MFNLYSMKRNVHATRRLFAPINSSVGNLPSMPGIFPDCPAPSSAMCLRRWPTKGSGIGSATIWTHLEGHDCVRVAVTGAPALQLHHLLEFESLYGELICQAFEKCALLRVARSPAHKGQIRGIGTEFVQFFP
ncbi:hypothetical protein [Bradyrhizobium sp. 145]|uniref:hypothetical protein n=1 Tax=unclassified Bradyrhizobium TaxID=2631580 RepID=UPI002A3EEB53|nr:hypothetical protein [Bradyrhizobium sp. 17]MCK1689259.1 hypothetical protein [Bradyrhizobium sp. 145]